MKSESSGLEQKLYIRTATQVRGDSPATVNAYPSPMREDCYGQCRKLSRFSGYFVFAIDTEHNSYLLSESYKLLDSTSLVGWVSATDGFVWDSAYGIRPREDLIFPPGTIIDGKDMSGQERAICAYQTLEDAVNNPVNRCLPILGGDRWYESEHRITIIDRLSYTGNGFYRVVLPLAGKGIEYENENGEIRIMTPSSGNPGIEALSNMKNVDVLFLIDGTSSMAPYWDVIKGPLEAGKPSIVRQIIRSLSEDDDFSETQLRFGLRVYRGVQVEPSYIEEVLPMSSDCDWTEEMQEQNLDQFHYVLGRLKTDDYDQYGSYATDLFGGIRKAIKDISSCPDNTKLLFSIC